MKWTITGAREVCEALVHCVEQSHSQNAASIAKKRTIQRRSELLEKAAAGVRTGDPCDGARIHEAVAGDLPTEDDSGREQSDADAGGTGEKV